VHFINSKSHTIFFSIKGKPISNKVARHTQLRPTRIHYTRAYIKKRIMSTEQENIELREEVSNLKVGLEKLKIMMEVMMAERERAEVSETIPTVVVSTPQPTPVAAGTS
jgi:hypothetical protein